MKRTHDAGFTLVEIMVVVVILGLLSTAVVVAAGRQVDRARITRAKTDLKTIEGAISLYRGEEHAYPASIADLGKRAPDGGRYLKRADEIVDPWNRPYRYETTGDRDHPFRIWSVGEDESLETDDIVLIGED